MITEKPNSNRIEKIYIISWFGNDSIREKRKEIHKRQINWAKENNLEILVYQQEYNKNDYVHGIKYINDKNEKCLPGEARNECLKLFYNSNDDFCIIADNDSIIENPIQEIDFLKAFNSLSISELKDVDLFAPVNPVLVPFKKDIKQHEQKYRKKLVFIRNPGVKGSLFFVKNIKKFHNMEIYQDNDSFSDKNGNIIPGEDQDFGLQFLSNGLTCFSCKNIILKEFATKSTSTWIDKNFLNLHSTSKQILTKKYNLQGSKKFTAVGHSSYDGITKVRYAVDKIDRTRVLLYYKHNDIVFYDLPKPMRIEEIKPYVESVNFFDDDVLKNKIRLQKSRVEYEEVYKMSDKPKKVEILFGNKDHDKFFHWID